MPSTRLQRITRPATWTLRTKLVVAVLSLFTLVTLIVGTLTLGVASSYLNAQLRNDVRAAASRSEGVGGLAPVPQRFPDRGHDDDDGPRGIPGGGSQALVLWVDASGQVTVDRSGTALNTVVNRKGEVDQLDASQVAQLVAARLSDEPRRVEVTGDVGSYLLVSTPTVTGGQRIVGLPMRGVDGVIATLLRLILGGLLLGLVGMWLGGRYLIRRNLEPLSRVAAVAQRVSSLRLDQGQVTLPERVDTPAAEAHTEVGQVGTALNTMLDNVESALRAREASESKVRQFVADASHELRTPLASIRGYAELSRREREPVPTSVTHALGRVESEAVRMQGLVEDLLLLARLDAGRPLQRDQVDLTRIVVDAVGDASVTTRDHRWELGLPEDPVTAIGDEARLRQVLVNLLGNARSHTPPGTTVVTSLAVSGEVAVLTVRDDGPGIPVELQESVFERFTRGDAARTRGSGSTGLGLSIVAAVVQSHGGRVGVTSEPGRTEFRVELPLR